MNDADLLYAEDLEPGSTYELGEYVMTEREIIDFATTWDPQYFHLDPEQARHPRFTGVIASGFHTAAVLHRLTLDGLYRGWAVVAGRSVDGLRFLRPVHPGAILTGTATIQDVQLDRPEMGLVVVSGALLDHSGAQVLRATVSTYVSRRPRAS